MKNISVYLGFLFLCLLLFVAYKLQLPEGWPRAVAFLVIVLVGIGMIWWSKRNAR